MIKKLCPLPLPVKSIEILANTQHQQPRISLCMVMPETKKSNLSVLKVRVGSCYSESEKSLMSEAGTCVLGGNRPWHFYMSVTTFSYIVDFKDACTADSPGNWRQC